MRVIVLGEGSASLHVCLHVRLDALNFDSLPSLQEDGQAVSLGLVALLDTGDEYLEHFPIDTIPETDH